MVVALIPLQPTRAQAPQPWETATGRACFQQWINESMGILNAFDGGSQFNARKPWSIHPQYGTIQGNSRIGPTSVAAPDNFGRYNNDRFWWMWDQYPVAFSYQWSYKAWRDAVVPALRPYVLACIADSTAGDSGPTATPGTSGTTGIPVSGGPTLPVDPTVSGTMPPPLGTPEPYPTDAFTIQAGMRRVVAGETIWVPVYLINAEDVSNMNFEIGPDESVVAVEGDPLAGNLLGGRAFRANPADAELIRFGFASTEGVSATGTVAWILFRAIGEPGDFTNLVVTVSEVNNPSGASLPIDRIAGQVQITDEEGRIPGDCDGDLTVSAYDAVCALEMSVQLRPEQINLDQDDDGNITSRDATIILQIDSRQI